LADVSTSLLDLVDLDRALDGDQTALGAGNGTADNQHVQLVVNLHNAQVLDRDLIDTHVAGADLALEDTGRIGGGAHGTSVTVDRAGTVSFLELVSTVALDNAGVA